MLLLTRKAGQKIIISGNIEVTILSVRGPSVKIGIDAPLDTIVNRAEVEIAVTHDPTGTCLSSFDRPVE